MKKLKSGKVILFAAGIILVCIAALVVSIHVAFGAETDKVAADFAAETETGITVAEENTGEPTPVSDLETGSSSASVSENKTVSGGTSPGAQFITQGTQLAPS